MHLSNALRLLLSSLSVLATDPCRTCEMHSSDKDRAVVPMEERCVLCSVLTHPDYEAWRAGEVMPAEPPRSERQMH